MRGFYSSKLYKNLPVLLQNLMVTAKGFAYSKYRKDSNFRSFCTELANNESLSADELTYYQLIKVKQLLDHAYEFVPYYKKLFNKLRFKPRHFQRLDDLKELPVLDKQTVRGNFDEFIATDARRRNLIKGSTSGSTGSPLSLYMDRKVVSSEHAFVWRQYRWAGCPINGRIASFRGDMIVPRGQIGPPYWRYDAYSKEMWFSSYDLSPDTAAIYLRALQKFDPELIYTYPSSLFALSQCLKSIGSKVSMPSLRGIVTSSETLFAQQKQCIEEIFGRPIFDWYGMFERVIFIGTCERGNYHVFPDYGVTELIPTSGVNADSMCELIGTGFINRVMPLIRYRTGDIVTVTKESCECGRAFPRVNSILGRTDDMVITEEGKIIGRLDHIFKGVEHIRLAQIIQEEIGKIIIIIVPEEGYCLQDKERILKNAFERLGAQIDIKINALGDIPRLPNVKFKMVVSNINVKKVTNNANME